jgi:multicomponent Na+:H+ antiporter subunit D
MMDINFITQTSLDFMLLFTIIAPLLCGIFALASSDTSRIRNYGIVILSLLHLINIFNIKYFYDNYGSFSYQFVKLGNVVEFSFATEQYGIIFAIMVSILWVATNIYSFGYIELEQSASVKKDTHIMKFNFFMSLSIAATFGIAFAANLLTMYICYELLTLATYPLVNIAGSEHAIKAGRKYFLMLTLTSLFLFLPAILYINDVAGELNFTEGGILIDKLSALEVFLLIGMIVFGVAKTALFPFHSWLPTAMVAPSPVSALLHAVAVVKSGIFVIIKIVLFIFGVDYLKKFSDEQSLVQNIFVLTCCFTILYASVKSIYQHKLKQMLAFSTISQLGYCMLAISLFSYSGVIASFIHMIAHAFAKIILFFCVGLLYTSASITDIEETKSISRYFPGAIKCFAIAVFALIGLPPLAGFFSKFLILLAAAENKLFWVIASTIVLSTVLTAVYFTRIIYNMYFNPAELEVAPFAVPITMKYTIFTVTGLLLLLPLIINYLLKYLSL